MCNQLKDHPYCNVYENYPCQYAGLDSKGTPLVKNLDEFGQAILEDLWYYVIRIPIHCYRYFSRDHL